MSEDDLAGLARRLDALSGGVKGTREIQNKIGDYMKREFAAQFASNGSRFGTPWAPLRPYTRWWKRTHGYPANTLIRTGRLFRSLTQHRQPRKRMGSMAVYGTKVPYARFHQHGTRYMVSRKIINMTPELSREIADVVRDYYTGRF